MIFWCKNVTNRHDPFGAERKFFGAEQYFRPFFRGGQQFLSAKTQSCSAKRYPLGGGQTLKFCSAKLMYHSFVSHCSASLNLGQKLLNDDSKTGKNGRKIGKYMAETKQKWLQTDKLGRKIYEIWRKRGMLAMFCFCSFKLSNSFLPNCQFLFCQATQFCSVKLFIFAPPRTPMNSKDNS